MLDKRAHAPLIMSGRRRVFVAPHDHLFGMLRMYSACQDNPTSVARTFDEALQVLQFATPPLGPVEGQGAT